MVDLVKNADAAMYRSKRVSRGNHQFYSAEMIASVRAATTVEHDLR